MSHGSKQCQIERIREEMQDVYRKTTNLHDPRLMELSHRLEELLIEQYRTQIANNKRKR